jgi:ribosome-associated protein
MVWCIGNGVSFRGTTMTENVERVALRARWIGMFKIYDGFEIPDEEIAISAIRASGPGGQNVNKVASAAHLRFDIAASSLPEEIKTRLLTLGDRRISSDGIIVIKSQLHRSLERNRADALQRLRELITRASVSRKSRRPTRPTRAAVRKRLESKTRRGETKALRRKPTV